MKTLFSIISLLVVSFSSAQSLSDSFNTVLKYDSVERFQILLEKADLNACYAVEGTEHTLLGLAIKEKAITCFNYLIAQKANLENVCAGKTPLMYAAKYGNLPAAKALIKAGAMVSTENSKGQKALDYAIKHEQKELQSYLESL